MELTKFTFKTFIDGLCAYAVWYICAALLLWLGVVLIDIYPVSYWQCLGAAIVFRQIRSNIIYRGDKHIKEKKKEAAKTDNY